MTSTGITVDLETSMICASNEWWKARESVCKITRSLKRQPPPFWDVMTLMARTYLNIMFLKPKKTKKYIGLTSMLIPIIQMNILKIQLGFLLEEVRNIQEVRNVQEVKNVQDVGAVHKEQEDVGVLRKRLVETQELMLEVLQEVIEEENHLRLQYKTQLMDIKNFNDRVYNSYAQLGSGQLFGSPHSGGLSGSSSSVGNSSRGNSFQNSGAPPTTKQWGTPRNVQHWEHHQMFKIGDTTKCSKLGNTTKCSILGDTTKCSTMGCTSKWSQLENASKCSIMEYTTMSSAMEHSTKFYHGHQASNIQQAGSSGTTPTNVQLRIYSWKSSWNSVEYSNTLFKSTLQRPRRGGRFNIWRTTEEPNEGHHSDSGDKD
ncbi:unnamed protein product [Brassica rapa subsp. trilocularis]